MTECKMFSSYNTRVNITFAIILLYWHSLRIECVAVYQSAKAFYVILVSELRCIFFKIINVFLFVKHLRAIYLKNYSIFLFNSCTYLWYTPKYSWYVKLSKETIKAYLVLVFTDRTMLGFFSRLCNIVCCKTDSWISSTRHGGVSSPIPDCVMTI